MIYTRKRELRNPILIGKIYADWCFHCKQLKPEWEKMKKKLRSMSKHFIFVEIESQEEEKMANFKRKYKGIQVNGYPTIFAIKDNKPEYYMGSRDANSLEQWVMSYKTINKRVSNNTRNQRRKRKLI